MNLIFLGPPGSGKGTQAIKVSEKLHLRHISTGDVLREAVKNQTDVGKEAEKYMSNGELVPDAVLINMIKNKITSGKLSSGFILDGFPRTIPQAESLNSLLRENDIALNYAVLFNVDDDEIVKRLSGRWFCPECNAGYNYPSKLPQADGMCDNDKTALMRRSDDAEGVVRNRLEVYKHNTEPIVDFYRNESILREINGDVTPNEVFGSIIEAIQ